MDLQRQIENERADYRRRWLLGIPYAAKRVRTKLVSPKETTP